MFQQLYYDFTVTEILSADVRGLGCKGHSNRPQYHASTAILWLHCDWNIECWCQRFRLQGSLLIGHITMFQQLYYDFTVTEILSADVRGLGCKGHS